MTRSLRPAAAAVAVVALAAVCSACSSDTGSKEAFCGQLPETADLFSLIGEVGASDPTAVRERFDEGLAEFRDLERAAPRELRADVGTVADAAERVLDAVERNAGDQAALAAELQRDRDQFLGAAKSALEVEQYAKQECNLDLGGSPPVTSAPTASVPPTRAPG